MQVVVENTGGLGRRMRVEVPAGQLHERIEKQVREYARSVNIKGFRRGKVPPMVVVAQLVEQRIVIPPVVGSSPIDHPILIKLFVPWFSKIKRTGPLAQW